MAHFAIHNKALKLRRRGLSYNQIKNQLGVSKSTLSYWLRDFPLSKQRIRELRDDNAQRIERFRETMRQKRERRLDLCYQSQKMRVLQLNNRELFLCGLFLYWGEGSKRHDVVGISNTDPALINVFIKWLTRCFGVSKSRMSVQLQLYADMDVGKEVGLWSCLLDIPKRQFIRPYIKKTNQKTINHKGSFGHGTCNLRINDVKLSENILMAIKVISDTYGHIK